MTAPTILACVPPMRRSISFIFLCGVESVRPTTTTCSANEAIAKPSANSVMGGVRYDYACIFFRQSASCR